MSFYQNHNLNAACSLIYHNRVSNNILFVLNNNITLYKESEINSQYLYKINYMLRR